MRFLVAAVALAACRPAQQPQLVDTTWPGVPAIDEDGARRYVADDRGLVEVAPSGATQPIARPPVSWCTIDDKIRVVWFRSAEGLVAFDLDDRHLYPIVIGALGEETLGIDHGNHPQASLVVVVSEAPALRGSRAKELEIADRAYLSSLYARGEMNLIAFRDCD